MTLFDYPVKRVLIVDEDDLPATSTNAYILNTLVPVPFNGVSIWYSGTADNISRIAYKLAGSTVAILDLGYAGTSLISVQKS